MPEIKKFTKDNPCSKIELWNCFRGPSGFRMAPVVEAHSVIGLNAPKYLLRESYATTRASAGVDYYVLSPAGERWLTKGLAAHLKRHPSEARRVQNPAGEPVSPAKKRSRILAR